MKKTLLCMGLALLVLCGSLVMINFFSKDLEARRADWGAYVRDEIGGGYIGYCDYKQPATTCCDISG